MSILFFDVDGTLVDTETHKIPKSAISGIKRAQAKENLCMISTGRHLYKLFEIKGISDIEWDGYVLDNGSLILDKEKNIIKKHFLKENQVEDIISMCKAEDMVCTLQLMNEIIAPLGYSNYLKSTYKFLNWKVEDKIRNYAGEEVVYAIIYNSINYNFKKFNAVNNIEIFPNNSDYADINYASATKANGIKELLDFYNLDNSDTYCFGDSHNDIEMFHYIKKSIAMGNACDELKSIASHITTDVSCDGVDNALRHFKLY